MKSRLKNRRRKNSAMSKIYTKEAIKEQLAAMNAPKNSVVIMHTSLRAVGSVENRGEGLLDALIEYFTAEGGLFVVPTHTWENLSDPSVPTMDMSSDYTSIGKFPSIAAAHPEGHRSMHPSHSVVVFGETAAAEAFIKAEETVDSMVSPDGCYGDIYRRGGYVLLVGVGHESNTYLHAVEEMLDVPNRVETQPSCHTTIKTKTGEIVNRQLRDFAAEGIGDVSRQYPKFEAAFRHHGCIIDGFIGDAKAQLCEAVKMKEVLELIYLRCKGEEILADKSPLNEKYYIKEVL